MTVRIDLNFDTNFDCSRKCNRETRKRLTENDLCIETNSVIDNLPIRCVGQWGMQKIYLLVQYFGIFSTGMKNKWKLNYIEICSGPGRSIDRSTGREFDGTARSIVQQKAFGNIQKALFFDFNSTIVETLNKRLENLGVNNAKALLGDYTRPDEFCQIIQSEIDPCSLNLCFIDPTDCSVPFRLIKEIKDVLPNVDFIINLASGTDFNRNIQNAILKEHKKLQLKYSEFLGTTEFFTDEQNIEYAQNKMNLELRNNFREYYKESLRTLGYKHFDFKRIQHYYDVLFASSHKKGIEFWKKATKISIDGQRELF